MTCLVTGGSRGIGHAIAFKLAAEGASCIVLSRNLEAARVAIAKLDCANGQTHVAAEFDVAAARRPWTAEDIGGLPLQSVDVVINAAGLAQNKLLFVSSPDEIEDIVATNLMGTIYSCRSFSRSMMRRKEGGCIVNISSVLANRAARGSSVYAACKAGVEGLTKALATELGAKNVRVNAIRPGFIQTGMLDSHVSSDAQHAFLSSIPSSRAGTVDEVADAALFLVKNKYCNGTILTVDGGFSSTL
ncbi:NAD(P)-binding protein [Lipomyces arxii]|uniref:NAD(P)-binding protein n=1 Tax=Lipomyces arxii TaxID=56418 RepID=UPI0034D00685